jgi:transposase
MLTMEGWATIRYLYAQGKGIRAIGKELGVARKTVRRALRAEATPKYERSRRPNPKLDPFCPTIRELYFRKHLIGSRILREIRAQGYTGGSTPLYVYLRTLRVVPSGKVTERFETAPGHQAQFDWSPYTIELGGELRRVIVYGMTLGYSRRKHYTASLDERQPSIFEAIEESFWHFGGAPKELLVDNAKAMVIDANPAHFHWNPQFLELTGHYRVQPRACQVRRAQTKGKVEKPFFYLEQQFIKGNTWTSFTHFQEELARFEREDLDVTIHHTTLERPIDRFAAEQPLLTGLPAVRFVGTLALSRKVSWDCLVSYAGSRYSVPAGYASKMVWVLPSHGSHIQVVNGRRETIAEHALSQVKGATVINREHYASLRRGTPRTHVVLSQQFLARFPHDADFLEGLQLQHTHNPAEHLRGVMELASLYDERSMRRAFALAREYKTYSHAFVRGLLESRAIPQAVEPDRPSDLASPLPTATVQTDLRPYQELLWEAGR